MNSRSFLSAFLISLLICGPVFICAVRFGTVQGSAESFSVSGYILDSDGRGVAGAMIIFNVPDVVPAVYSDSSGHYVVSAPAGTYHVNVWPPFDSNYIYYDEPTFVIYSDVTKNITLNSGYKVSGYITDSSGAPVVKAVVSLNNFFCGWYSNYSGYYFVTASAGTYTLGARPANGPQDVTIFSPYSESNVVVNGNLAKNITVNSLPAPSANTLDVELETTLDGQASFSAEKTHTSSYSAKLVIPENAERSSCAFALYPYNKPLSSISTFSVFASFENAVPVFVFRLDRNGDGVADISLMSDYPFAGNGEWKDTTVGNRWGWTEASNYLSTYGKTWEPLDYWKNQYGNATVLYIGIALEYWAMDPDGYGEPLYVDELTVNGVTYNIVPAPSPSPIPSLDILDVEFQHKYDGQALFTTEKVHTSSKSVKLVIPENAVQGSYAMALYPCNRTLNSISSFSIFTSYNNAFPRFMLCLGNGVGLADTFLMSDYQFASNGEWKATTGGNRWGWTETNFDMTNYGQVWNPIDYWVAKYGDLKVLCIGVVLEYWAVEPDGYGEPLYADELVLDGVSYNIAPTIIPSLGTSNQSWPMFHNDLANSGYSENTGPLTNQILWKHQVGTGIESSPAVVDGVVYFGSLWNGHNGFVNALNATTGSKIWQFATNSGVESSPAVVDGVVYIGSYSGNVYALDAANGAEIWSFNTGGSVFPSPAVIDGVVYVGSATGNMHALNAANGSPIWSYHTGGRIFSSPAVVDGIVYFGSEDQNFYALKASDGSKIWNFTTGGYIDASPAVVNGIVYVGSRDGFIYSLNATSGSKVWAFYPPHRYYSGGPYYYSTPAVNDGIVYIGSYDNYVYALNAATSDLVWESQVGDYIFSSPIVAGGVVYVGSFDGNVCAINAATGDKIWGYQTGDKIRSSFAVANGVAYVGSGDGYLYAFGSINAEPDASCEISGYILDENGNGIADAHITFNAPPIPSVTSDPSGYYVVTVPAGTYHVNVWPPFDSKYINYDELGFVVESDMTKNITLRSGYKVSGYVTDASGNPVVGAAVLLDNYGSGWFSNSSGYYFLNVPVGTYTITARPRTGDYYSGPTTDFPTYHEYNFTVNSDTVKNITVGNPAQTSSLNSEPQTSPEPASTLSTEPETSPQQSSTSPHTITPDQPPTTNAAPITLIGIILGTLIVATPIVGFISGCLMFYFKKRGR